MVLVSWNDALAYIEWLNGKAGEKYYRLFTEAECGYATRSGGKRYKYSWGNGSHQNNISNGSLVYKLYPKFQIWDGDDECDSIMGYSVLLYLCRKYLMA